MYQEQMYVVRVVNVDMLWIIDSKIPMTKEDAVRCVEYLYVLASVNQLNKDKTIKWNISARPV